MKTLVLLAAVAVAGNAFAAPLAPRFSPTLPKLADMDRPQAPEAGEAPAVRTETDPVLNIGTAEPIMAPDWTQLMVKVDLDQQLDRHMRIQNLLWNFNGHNMYTSVALDKDRNFFLAFTPADGGATVLAPTGDLLKHPAEVQLTGDTRYKVSLKINIFDPINSTIVMEPQGNGGQTHKVKGGKLQEYVRANAPSFSYGGNYIMLYGHHAEGSSLRMGQAKSFYFLKDAGFNSKAYSITEDQVPVGGWASAQLGDVKVLLYRPTEGQLEIHRP